MNHPNLSDESKSEIVKSEYWLDHATESGTRHFIIHGPLPKGLNDAWGYPICDSMNRHHCISPEEDEANGKLILHALNCRAELLEVAKLVVAYFGNDKIPAYLDGDIRLRDAAKAAIAKAEGGNP